MKTENVLPTLPNGLPLYKLMRYNTTKEQCQIIKVVPENTIMKTVYDPDSATWIEMPTSVPLTVNIKIKRITSNIKHFVIVKNVLPFELEVWNERMHPPREVRYLTRKRQARTVYYN